VPPQPEPRARPQTRPQAQQHPGRQPQSEARPRPQQRPARPPQAQPQPQPPRQPYSYAEPYRYAQPRQQPEPPSPRDRRRTLAIALCLVLGLGLLGGAAAGTWLTGGPEDRALSSQQQLAQSFAAARAVWHSVPVDTLFPPRIGGRAAGPGGADRTWIRVGVAAPGGCADAFDPLLAKVLAPVGCVRLLRATYTDATSSDVTTVGVVVTKADAAGMRSLGSRWNSQRLGDRTDLIPRPVAFPGTDAAAFGDRQRASWTVDISTDLPLIVFAVSGFADGRAVTAPQSAAQATAAGATTAPAQSGLGNDAQGLSDAVNTRARKAAAALGAAATEAP
jgi:hypothetical protein